MADDSKAGTWSLALTASEHPATESMLLPSQMKDGKPASSEEAAFEPDNRTLVAESEFAPGGQYRCIVKLQIRYEKQGADDERYAMGTGWLIRPDLLVTAGHCVYDWSQDGGLGRAVSVKAWIGYNGKKSINSRSVQFRQGVQIVTTSGWLSSADNRTNDVSFVRLDSPFVDPPATPLTPFRFAGTPGTGTDILGVVGYPGDMSFNGEKGAQMYEEFGLVKFDITTSDQHMLNYRISTYAVLRQKDRISIGAHVYGGSKQNSASPIMSQWGNPYKDYIAIFDKKLALAKGKGITFVALEHTESDMDDAAEGFFDVFKSVVKVVAPIAGNVLQVATPFLGPIGAPVAAIAGTALGVASKLTESSMAESSMGGSISTRGIAERAALGEAALQTVLKMDHDAVQESGIFDTMKSVYAKLGPVVTKVAPKLIPALVEPALRVALDQIQKSQAAPGAESAINALSSFSVPPPPASFKSVKLDAATESFSTALTTAMPTPKTDGAEGFMDIFSSIVQTGLKVVPIVAPALGKLLGGTESEMEPTPTEAAMTKLFQRAAMGEAALQALIKHHSEDKEEGFFGDFLDTVQNIGSQVIKVAPSVIQTAAPIVLQLLKTSSTESAIVGDPTSQTPGPKKGPKHKPSVAEWLNDTTSMSLLTGTPTGHPSANADKTKTRSKMAVRFMTASQTARPTGFEEGSTRMPLESTGGATPRSDVTRDASHSPTQTRNMNLRESDVEGDESQSLPPTDMATVPDKSAPPDVPQEVQRDGMQWQS
ncbi:hypothetical protein H2200_007491 [Cladophialophora chaetospira]|uniref:Peptidase S1 domain-containing protein n=1 Tax=Cladophialophora chaetospira TaxID=386627 RepID=A0AA39CHQ3_9EURO|nr:hypothetical protein H2200_007491 [Cladophialophora chaetospira]